MRVLSPEDFVLFKILSTRDRDLSDAISVLRRSGDALDLERIEAEIECLAAELPDVEVRDRYGHLRA